MNHKNKILISIILLSIILIYYRTYMQFSIEKNTLNNHNSDIKLIKKIANGLASHIYKCRIKDIYGVYKIEKININDVVADNKSNYIRQIDFSINLGNKYPNKFLSLVDNGIIHNCNHTINILPKLPEILKKELNKLNHHKSCCYLVYTPILDNTLKNIINELSDIEYKQMVEQIKDSIDIMHANSYYHRDIHDENIMYKKINNNYQWYIIDYGTIYNDKYNQNYIDIILKKNIL